MEVLRRCSGSGATASRVLDPHYQQCRVCNAGLWLTPRGYFPAHDTPGRIRLEPEDPDDVRARDRVRPTDLVYSRTRTKMGDPFGPREVVARAPVEEAR